VFSAADAAGFTKDQAKRAKKRLGVEARRPGGEGPWLWVKPELGSTEQEGTPSRVGVLPSPSAAPLQGRAGAENGETGQPEAREQSARDCSLALPSPTFHPPARLEGSNAQPQGGEDGSQDGMPPTLPPSPPSAAVTPGDLRHDSPGQTPRVQAALAKVTAFKPPTGPGRCPECHWHINTQGHSQDCDVREAS
jgi:hypothetical protein